MNKKFKDNNIDMESFSKGLFFCVAATKANCDEIDRRVTRLTNASAVKGLSTMEHFESVIDLRNNKHDLVALYNTFARWWKGLDNEVWKKLYAAYFVKRDTLLTKSLAKNYSTAIRSMGNNFINYISNKNDFTIEELIKNPFVYDSYKDVLRNKNKKRERHDGTANERYDIGCVRH